MQSVEEIRKANVRYLIEEAKKKDSTIKSDNDFYKKYSLSQSYFSQVFSDDSTKTLGDKAARNAEKKLGLEYRNLDFPLFKLPLDHADGIIRPFLDEHDPDGIITPENASEFVLVPLYDVKAACGKGYTNSEELVKGGLSFREKLLRRLGVSPVWGNSGLIYADGLSMKPNINHCDALLLNLVHEGVGSIRSDRVYAFVINNEVRVKRLFREISGRLRIVSDNPDKLNYPDEFLEKEELNTLTLIGHIPWRAGEL